MIKRGIVIGSHWQLERVRFSGGSGPGPGSPDYRPSFEAGNYLPQLQSVDPAMRRSLLYFDRIDWPSTNVERPTLPGIDLLEEQGLVQRTHVMIPEQMRRSLGVVAGIGAHRWVFEQLAAQPDCVWSLAHIVDPPDAHWKKLEDTQADIATRRAVSLELYNSLPVPAPGVPLEDIIDFKGRNLDPLMTLRSYMDDLYQEVISSGDVLQAKSAALNKVDRALAEVWRAMDASKLRARLAHFRVDLLLVEAALGAGAGMKLAELVQQPQPRGAMFGAALGAYRFLHRVVPSPIERAGPLAYYLAGAARERVIAPPRPKQVA
jgi:hypothetical protein